MISGILEVVGSGLAILRAFTDPDKKEKSFNLAIRKNTRKALNYAEDIMELVDEQLSTLPKQFQYKYKKLKRKFNDAD